MVFNCFIGESFRVNGAQEVNHKADGSRGPVGRGHEVWKATCPAPSWSHALGRGGERKQEGRESWGKDETALVPKEKFTRRALGISSFFRVLYAKTMVNENGQNE